MDEMFVLGVVGEVRCIVCVVGEGDTELRNIDARQLTSTQYSSLYS